MKQDMEAAIEDIARIFNAARIICSDSLLRSRFRHIKLTNKAVKICLENTDDFETIFLCIRLGYSNFVSDSESAAELHEAMLNPNIPRSWIEYINSEIEESKKQRTNPKEEKIPFSRITNIYFMSRSKSSLTKIGYTDNLDQREKSLQSVDPSVHVVCSWKAPIKLEKMLHKKYAHRRRHGEWFEMTSEDLCEASEFCNQHGTPNPDKDL